MLKELEQLLVLQDRDRKIRALRQELKHAPLERAQLAEKVSGSQGTLDSSKLKGREIEVERKKLEDEVKSKRDQITKYQLAKFQTRKNEEFQAMTTAIEHLERDIRLLEDKEIEFMESAEVLKPQTAQADAAAQAMKAQAVRQNTDLDAKVATVEKQLADHQIQRDRLAAEVEEDLLDRYDRLFTKKGEAVVALEADICTGCHMKVTTSTAVKTKGGREIVECEQCGRILYWNPS